MAFVKCKKIREHKVIKHKEFMAQTFMRHKEFMFHKEFMKDIAFIHHSKLIRLVFEGYRSEEKPYLVKGNKNFIGVQVQIINVYPLKFELYY